MEVRVTDTLDGARWHTIFMLLGLDSAEPYLPAMGLELPHVAAMRSIARQYLGEAESVEKISSEDEYLERSSDLLQRTFARIAETINQEAASTLYRWGKEDFIYGNSGASFFWENLLARLAAVYEEPIAPPRLPLWKLDVIKQTIKDQLGESFSQLSDELDEVPNNLKSSWDENFYRTYMTNDPDMVGTLGPLINLWSAIRNLRLRLVWRSIKSVLSEEDREVFVEWAKAEANQQGISDFRSPPGGW